MSTTTSKSESEIAEIPAGNDLPEGWAVAPLGTLASPSKEKIEPDQVPNAPYLSLEHVESNTLRIIGHGFGRDVKSTKTIFRPGDVLYGKLRPYLNKVCIPNFDGICSTDFFVFKRNKWIENRLLLWFLSRPEVVEIANHHSTGVELPRVDFQTLANLPFPILPRAEQVRIVAKIEKLFAQVNAARTRLANVSQILKRFRQAVLAAACSGRLTEDWRENNPISDNITEIVETIYRRRQSESHSRGQKEKLRQIYQSSEENDSSQLPEEWGFTALNKLCASFDYGTSAKSKPSGLVPVLRMGNIQDSKIDWSNLVYTSDRQEIRKYSLAPNTVLFNRTNSPELVGKTALYEGERPAIFAGYLIRIVTQPELDPCYLNLCLNTSYAREFCSQVKTDGVSQSNINAQKLGMFEVPFCPLAEQHEIVRRVEAFFKLADSIEKRVEAATKRTDKLTQAILAKAFRGELVPTEAELARREGRDFESAAELLVWIKAERERSQKSRR